MTNFSKFEFSRNWVIFFAVSPLFYNAVLAIINAHVITINLFFVAATEILILSLVALYVFRDGLKKSHAFAIGLLVTAFLSAILTYLASGIIYIDFIRNIMIVSFFSLLGADLEKDEIIGIFKISLAAVLSVLILEVLDISLYVELFQPALYFSNTRGNEISEFNDIGVFGNALGFDGRFGYGVFSGPRTSSIFLEQVTLGNMTAVIAIFFSAFYTSLSRTWKISAVIFILLSLLSSESRLALVVVTISLIGFFVFPHVHKIWLLLAGFCVVIFGVMYAALNPIYSGDNFSGRISLGFGHLIDLSLIDFIGAGVGKVGGLWDAGYAYIFCSGTVFGATYFFIYLYGLYNLDSIATRRFFSGLIIFILVALSIGGTAIFSIKFSYLFWLTAGYFSKKLTVESTFRSR
jgi:hypothetical protein